MLLSVVIPAYKQEKTIVKDVGNIERELEKLPPEYEIIVIDDGSPDKTARELKKIASPRVKVFSYRENRGKGYALRYGAARAAGELVAFLDAGMEINPQGLSTLWEYLKEYQADVVVGSKRHPASRVNYPLSRRLFSFGYQFLVWLLFGLRVKDTQTGLKLFRREVLAKVMPRLLIKQYAIDIEILAVTNYLGFRRIYEAPVEVTYRFEDLTHASALRPVWRMFLDTLAVFYRLKILRYYDDKNRRKWDDDKDLGMETWGSGL